MNLQTLSDLVDALGRSRLASPAIHYGKKVLSYDELARSSRKVAGGLSRLGIGKGDRVAFWLPNTPAYVVLYLACARLGAIMVAVNTRFRSVELQDILARSGAKALIVWPDFLGIPFLDILSAVDPSMLERLETLVLYGEETGERRVLSPTNRCKVVRYADLLKHPEMKNDLAGRADASNIFITSGTTKAPKFALHSHGGILDHARHVVEAFGYSEPGSVMLQALPLCGIFGFSQFTATLAAGRPMVLMKVFDPEEAVRLSIEHKVTYINGSDDLLYRMLQCAPGERPFPSLRYCVYATFNSTLGNIVEYADTRGMHLANAFGMSEIQSFYSRQPLEAPPEVRCLPGGVPVDPRAQVRVRDVETGNLLEHGDVGELEVTGASLMTGYYLDQESTAAAFTEDGFFRTGDLGYLKSDGSFVFLSRKGDMLRLGGFLVNPVEIEVEIQNFPGIEGVQVVGVPTPSGNRAVAFVILKPGALLDEKALQDYCRSRLAGYKAPMRYLTLQEFPATMGPNGMKIQRSRLRQMAVDLIRQGG